MRVEKRKDPRLDFGVLVLHDNKRKMTKNISLNGTFIKRDKLHDQSPLPPIGSEIGFSFDFPNTERYIDVKGIVVHHGNNNDGMGIWFKKIDEKDREFIKIFILDYL